MTKLKEALTKIAAKGAAVALIGSAMVAYNAVANENAPNVSDQATQVQADDKISSRTNEHGFSVSCTYPEIDNFLKTVKASAIKDIVSKVKSLPSTEDTERLLYEYAESRAYVQKVSEIFKEFEHSTLKTQMAKSGGHIESIARLSQGLNACLEKAKINGEFSWDAETLTAIDEALWEKREGSDWPPARGDVEYNSEEAAASGPKL